MITFNEGLTCKDFQHLTGLVLTSVKDDEEGNILFKFENDNGVVADMKFSIEGNIHVSNVYSPSFLREIGMLPKIIS